MASAIETCSLSIDGRPFSFDVGGEFTWGKDEVLYPASGVLSRTDWHRAGFNVFRLFDDAQQRQLVEGTASIITKIFDELGYEYPADFRLENYHKVATTPERHQAVIRRTRFLTNQDFPIDFASVAEKVSRFLARTVSGHNPILAVSENAPKSREIVILRISRPQSLDINPPHRDGYLDIWKHTVNLWIPVAGCNQNSSLPLIAGSHLWNERDIYRTEAKGASINGLSYHVPAILKSNHGLTMTRPNPAVGEALVFTPFLLHGAAVNLNEDTTRFSFELRLFDDDAEFKSQAGS
jgi:hypothetical protein